MKTKTVIALALGLVVLAITLFYIQGGPSEEQPLSPELIPVTVNQAFQHPLYIVLYVAKDAGFFEEQGLDVTINTGGATRRRSPP